jgi:hypothetical protein
MKRTKDELLLDCIAQFKHLEDIYGGFNEVSSTRSLISEITESLEK